MREIELIWTDFKKILDDRNLFIHFNISGRIYEIYALEGSFTYSTRVSISEPKNQDQIDFEENYQSKNIFQGKIHELVLSRNVDARREQFEEFIPESDSVIHIITFKAEAPYSLNSACKLVWNFDSENEEIIWSTRGNGDMPFIRSIPCEDIDGIKKLAITADNGEDVPLLMAVYCKFIEVKHE